MECQCTISVDHDGEPDAFTEKIRTARKEHRCGECYRTIMPGEKYEYVSGIWEGRPDNYKTCMDCLSLRETFFDSWIYMNLWDDFYNEFNYAVSVVPEACIAKLTPGARAEVCEMIEAGWED